MIQSLNACNALQTIKQLQKHLVSRDVNQYRKRDFAKAYRISDMLMGITHANHSLDKNVSRNLDTFCENKQNLLACRFLEEFHYRKFSREEFHYFAKWLRQNVRVTQEKLPNTMLVVHLRIGDVINANNTRYFRQMSYYKTVQIPTCIRDVVLVAGAHKRLSMVRSVTYVHGVAITFQRRGYNTSLLINASADESLVFIVRSRYFLSGMGGFAELLERMVVQFGGVLISNRSTA